MADDDLKITIEPDELPLDGGKEAPKDEVVAKVAPEDEAVKDLQAQLQQQKAAREAAERRAADAAKTAQQATQEASVAKTEVAESQLNTVISGLSAATAEADAAAQEYEAALSAGEFNKATLAQRKISRAEARIVQLEEAKADLEARKATEPTRKVETQPQPPADPVEAYISNRTEPTANWLRKHTDFITDPRKNAKLTSAHWDAVGEGFKADTDEYFSHVETLLGLKEKVEAKPNGQQQPARRATPAVAPVNASGGGVSGGSKEVKLSQKEALAATDGTHTWGAHDLAAGRIKDKSLIGQAIGVQEMARRKLWGMEQGLYDRIYLEQ